MACVCVTAAGEAGKAVCVTIGASLVWIQGGGGRAPRPTEECVKWHT